MSKDEVEIKLNAITFSGEYLGCGSHLIAMEVTIDREELESLLIQIKEKLEGKDDPIK